MGMSNMAATIPGFAVPALVGVLTHGTVSDFTFMLNHNFDLIHQCRSSMALLLGTWCFT